MTSQPVPGASKLCACRVNGGILLGRYLYQKGAYGYGGERQDDEGSEAKLSLDLSPHRPVLPSPPSPPLEAPRKVLGRQ